MASKRRYPYKRCENPNCSDPYFEPHDKRQRYCSPQCNDNYHNDVRSLKEKNLKNRLKKIDASDQLLEIAYLHMGYNSEPIDELMLELLNIDLGQAKLEKSIKSANEIHWFNRFGLLKLNGKGKNYKLICRNDF